MERPYVNLNSENKFAQLMNEVHSSMDRFLAFGEVVAVMLSGGLSLEVTATICQILTSPSFSPRSSTRSTEWRKRRCPSE